MPFFKYDSVFPYLHECQECEAQFVSLVPDISQVFKERRKTVRAKRPVQQAKCKMPPSCAECVCVKKCKFQKHEAFGCYQTLWRHFAHLP